MVRFKGRRPDGKDITCKEIRNTEIGASALYYILCGMIFRKAATEGDHIFLNKHGIKYVTEVLGIVYNVKEIKLYEIYYKIQRLRCRQE